MEVPFQTPPYTGRPHLIESDNNELTTHRYPLQSKLNCVVDMTSLLLALETNEVIEKGSGNLLEYRYLVKGPDSKIWRTSCAEKFDCLA